MYDYDRKRHEQIVANGIATDKVDAVSELLIWAKSALADHDEAGSVSLAGIGRLRSAVERMDAEHA